MNNLNLIAQAKQRLPLPALMALCGHGERAQKSARCMFHEDSHNSFSAYQRQDGTWAWKCHAGCGGGDEVDWLAKLRGQSNSDACREHIRLAGVSAPQTPGRPESPFDWQQCVSDFTPEHAARFAKWRSLSPEFVAWLRGRHLIGQFRNHLAFPVHAAGGAVVRAHVRAVKSQPDGTENVFWFYTPKGPGLPLVIGDPRAAKTIWAFESQFDMFAALDLVGWHKSPDDLRDFAATATRGAASGKCIAGLFSPDATLVLFPQNDPPRPDCTQTPAQKWTNDVAANASCKTVQLVTTPGDFKDLNDALRAGLAPEQFQTLLAGAQPYIPQADLHATLPPKVSASLIELPDDQSEPEAEPFPIECLPPDIALMVRAVATALLVPDSLPGLMALAIVAAGIGKGLVLDWRPGKNPTPANLFIIPTAESGSGKSECFKILAAVFMAFERAMQEHWRKETLPLLQTDLRFHETQLKKLDRKLGKDSTSADETDRLRGEMKYHLAFVEELKSKLHEPQLSIQDATVEKAATVMHWNGETLFSVSGDARKLVDNLLGRYSANKKIADDAIYLNSFSGDDVKVDRQGREGVRLANPCLTLLWALQPDALNLLLNEDSLQQGGFLARCLLAHTRAEPQHIGSEINPILDDTRAHWENLVRNLLITYRQPSTSPDLEPKDNIES
jgi:hypothetical protein